MTKRKRPNRISTQSGSSRRTAQSSVGNNSTLARSTRSKRSGDWKHANSRTHRRTPYLIASISAATILVAVLILTVLPSPASKSPSDTDVATSTVTGPPGPEGVPLQVGKLLAPESSAANGSTVDEIACETTEQVAYHVHVHLSVYVNGTFRPLPAGIGIVAPIPQATVDGPFDSASNCYYWLHVHAQDGVIHIESPTPRSYTLGQFFDLWRQPLTSTRIAGVTGKMVVFVNGVRDLGNPRAIQLRSHLDIQIDVGAPIVAPKRVNWGHTQL
jgi:hypothetical protein